MSVMIQKRAMFTGFEMDIWVSGWGEGDGSWSCGIWLEMQYCHATLGTETINVSLSLSPGFPLSLRQLDTPLYLTAAAQPCSRWLEILQPAYFELVQNSDNTFSVFM